MPKEIKAIKKQGKLPAHLPVGACEAPIKSQSFNERKIMIFDPQIVAYAKTFVNAYREGKHARVPAIRFEYWQQFMTTVRAELNF